MAAPPPPPMPAAGMAAPPPPPIAGLTASRPVQVVKSAAPSGRMNLLDAIRAKQGVGGLKKATEGPKIGEAPKPAAKEGGLAGLFAKPDVATMMAQAMGKRRNAMDDDDDDEDDWDDDEDSD